MRPTTPRWQSRLSLFRYRMIQAMVVAIAASFGAGISDGRASAADYRLEKLAGKAPTGKLGDAVRKTLREEGVRIIRGTSRTYCNIWLCKEIARGNAAVGGYPFQSGTLVGVIEFARKGGDFRDQEIPKGVYTMRFAAIPTDGAHEGVSPTPAFLLLTSAELDRDPAPVDIEALVERSAESIDSSHPAILALKPTVGDGAPKIWHDEDNDWWLVQLASGTSSKRTLLAFVIVGYTEE